MKRIKKLVASLLAVLSLVAGSVGLTACVLTGGGSGSGSGSSSEASSEASSSEDTQPRGVVYEIVDDTAQVVEYDGTETSVTIEATYEGVAVTKIGDNAFKGCTSLTEIVIPESVTSIGNFAFQDCSGLTAVVIPDSVTSIGNFAFEFCSSMTSVTIGESVTSMGECLFAECGRLSSITFNGTVEKWDEIQKGSGWILRIPATKVVCSDGEVDL